MVPWRQTIAAAPLTWMAAHIHIVPLQAPVLPSIQVNGMEVATTPFSLNAPNGDLSGPIANYHDKEIACNPCAPYQWCMVDSHSHLVQAWPNKHPICSAPKYACPLCLQLISMHQHFCMVLHKGITKLPWAKGMQFMKLAKFNAASAICHKIS